MSEVVEQMEQLLKGATMDDMQALVENSMESVRDSLPAMKEQREGMDAPKAAKMDEAIKKTEELLAYYDEMRAKHA